MARIVDQIKGHGQRLQALIRCAQEGSLGSSLLLCGPSGVGKRQVALGLAQILICEGEGLGCGVCPACLRVEKRQSESLLMIEGQETIKIDEVREVIKALSLVKWGRARVVLIDDAHLMTAQACNALLKVLEEPPKDSYFFLVTHQERSLLSTIRSRCETLRFGYLSRDVVEEVCGVSGWLASQGSVEMAQKLADSDWEQARSKLNSFFFTLLEGDRSKGFELARELARDRTQLTFFCREGQALMRDVRMNQEEIAISMFEDQRELIQRLNSLSGNAILEVGQSLIQMERDAFTNVDRTLLLENFWLASKEIFSVSSNEGGL